MSIPNAQPISCGERSKQWWNFDIVERNFVHILSKKLNGRWGDYRDVNESTWAGSSFFKASFFWPELSRASLIFFIERFSFFFKRSAQLKPTPQNGAWPDPWLDTSEPWAGWLRLFLDWAMGGSSQQARLQSLPLLQSSATPKIALMIAIHHNWERNCSDSKLDLMALLISKAISPEHI